VSRINAELRNASMTAIFMVG